MKWTLISDDLSGACETGSAINQELNNTGSPLQSFLSVELYTTRSKPAFPAISLIDLNIRDCTPEDGEVIFLDLLKILELKNPESINFFKVDSLLRGNIAMQVNILAKSNPLIFIPAIPALDRTVENGEVFLKDVALQATSHWKDEIGSPPRKIGELFPDLKVIYSASQSTDEMENILRNLLPGEIYIPDIHSAKDLATVAGILTRFAQVIAIGSAQFAAAHFSAHRSTQTFHSLQVTFGKSQGIKVFVGSDSGISLAQLAYLQSANHTPASATDKFVKVTQRDDLSRLVVGDFVESTLFISGGTTARRLLDEAGINELRMLNSLEYGVALGVSSNNQLIAIKPGSFGSEDTISKSLTAMLAISTLSNRN